MQLEIGVVVMVMLYLVYAQPSIQCQTDSLPQQRSQADMHDGYQWHLVTRSGSHFTLCGLCHGHNDYMMLLHMRPLTHLPKPTGSEHALGQY